MAQIAFPPHAYVPGRTPRHPEGLFDAVRASVPRAMSGAQVAASPAWAAARAYYGAGFYWEAHELLEPVWMATAPGSAERHLVQAFIQLANARLKLRMERPKAVARLCCLSREHLVAAAVAGGPGAGFRIDQSWIAAEIAAVEGLICADEQNNA